MSTVVTNSISSVNINQYTNGVLTNQFALAPGKQATTLPSWVPSTPDYTALVADSVFSVLTEASSVNLTGEYSTSQNTLLSTTGAPTTLLITNPGNQPAWVQLGSSTVSVAPGAGVLVAPGATVSLAIGSNTYLAYVGMTVLELVLGS